MIDYTKHGLRRRGRDAHRRREAARRLRLRRCDDLSRQHRLSRAARDARAVRAIERRCPALRSAAVEPERVALSHAPDARALHRHARRARLACRRCARLGARWLALRCASIARCRSRRRGMRIARSRSVARPERFCSFRDAFRVTRAAAARHADDAPSLDRPLASPCSSAPARDSRTRRRPPPRRRRVARLDRPSLRTPRARSSAPPARCRARRR